MCYFQFILAGGLWRLWVPKKTSASTGTQYKQHMLFSWKPGLWSKEYLNSILKDQMSSPLSRPISGFGLDLLLRKVIHSNEVLWGLPQCSRCFYVTCIWNVWHQRQPCCKDITIQDHWKHHFTQFARLAWRLRRVTHWSLCLPAWGTFSLVAVRLKPCLSCIYPLFIWRMSSAYSVWGGIVSWLLRSVVDATVVFFSCFSHGMSWFFIPTSVRKGVQTVKKKKLTEMGWNKHICAALMLFFIIR